MKSIQQITALLQLAWNNCSRDIRDAYFLWIGGLVSIVVFGAFVLLNFAMNFQQYIDAEILSGSVTAADALLISGQFAIFNTISFFTFLFISVCLFEYSLAFLKVSFYYDDGNWKWFQRKNLTDEKLKAEILQIKRKKELIDTL